MNNVLEDFIYSLEVMNTKDLAANALDDVWLAELDEEELIVLIHEMIKRLPLDDDGDWYEEEPFIPEEEDLDWDGVS